MSENKAVTKAKSDVRDLIEAPKFREEIAKVLPKHCTPERMARVAVTALMKNPTLLDCTPASVLNCLMICSQAGLEPDGRLAHLIPYGTTCQLIFDWKGLVALAIRNGYESVYADKVCDGDEFSATVEDGIKKLTHRIDWRKPRGEPYAYYAVCKRKGEVDYEVMSKAEVDAVRSRSRAGKSGPWVTDYDEMAKKCPIRRMSKRWDLMPEIRDVINQDDDTPDFNAPKAEAKPIFASTAKVVTDVESEPMDDSGDVAGKPEGHPEPKPKEEAKAAPSGSPSGNIKKIRAALEAAKLSESQFIGNLATLGICDEAKSFEEIHQKDEAVIGMVVQNLASLVSNLKEAK